MDIITHWNDAALETNRVAHTTPVELEFDSRGPTGSSRALAIVHLAMHDAYFSIVPSATFGTYLSTLSSPKPGASAEAAVSAAAHATLSALFPAQKAYLDAHHAAAGLSAPGLSEGHAHGLEVARRILDARRNDPGTRDDGYAASVDRGDHRPDPEHPTQGFHAPFYGARSACFAVTSRHTLLAPPQPGEPDYNAGVVEVRAKGIAPELTGTLPTGSVARTPEETVIGLFWAYDGAKGLGTPPRLYNQIVRQVATAQANTVAQNARLFALVNVAMADAGILSWDDKYSYDLWRPVLGVREHDMSFGPAGTGGNTLDTDADPGWLPLGAPRTNELGKNFTPPFPAYPSGHATFGAAAFQSVRQYYGKGDYCADNLADGLSFVSEELNGVSTDNRGTVRPRHARTFADGLWQMIEENGRSRLYLGVHWLFDAFLCDAVTGTPDLTQNVGGVPLGLAIADDIAANGMSQSTAAGPRVV